MPTELNLAHGHLFVAVYSGQLDDVLAAHGVTHRELLDVPPSEAMRIATGWLRDTPDSAHRSALAHRLFGRRGIDVLDEMALPRPSLSHRIIAWLTR